MWYEVGCIFCPSEAVWGPRVFLRGTDYYKGIKVEITLEFWAHPYGSRPNLDGSTVTVLV